MGKILNDLNEALNEGYDYTALIKNFKPDGKLFPLTFDWTSDTQPEDLEGYSKSKIENAAEEISENATCSWNAEKSVLKIAFKIDKKRTVMYDNSIYKVAECIPEIIADEINNAEGTPGNAKTDDLIEYVCYYMDKYENNPYTEWDSTKQVLWLVFDLRRT